MALNLSEEAAAASWKLFADTVEAKSGKLPVKAVIFSHSHSDHFGGVGGIVTPEQVAKEPRSYTGQYLAPLLTGRTPIAEAAPKPARARRSSMREREPAE